MIYSISEKLETRAKSMITKFFHKAAENENPLIKDLVVQFDHFEKNFKNENILTLIDFI